MRKASVPILLAIALGIASAFAADAPSPWRFEGGVSVGNPTPLALVAGFGYKNVIFRAEGLGAHNGPNDFWCGYRGSLAWTFFRNLPFKLDVGVGGNSAWTRFKVPDQKYALHNMVDSEGEVFDYVYDVRHRRDAYWVTSVQVPLLVGGQWGRFYFLAGAKFDMALMTISTMKAEVSTLGEYKQYITPLHNIPAQGFIDNMPFVQQQSVAFKPNVTASVEIGCRLGEIYKEKGFDVPSQKVQYRIAGFVDYGILDSHIATGSPLMHVPATYSAKNPLEGLNACNVMSSKEVNDIRGAFTTLMVGVKFTVLFQLPKSKSCVICRDEPFRSSHGILE